MQPIVVGHKSAPSKARLRQNIYRRLSLKAMNESVNNLYRKINAWNMEKFTRVLRLRSKFKNIFIDFRVSNRLHTRLLICDLDIIG